MRDAGFVYVDWPESASRESRGVRVICGMASKLERPSPTTSMLLHRGAARDVSVYALNSPFIKNKPYPDQLPTIEELAAIYVAEIRRRQPEGRYLVGGHSVGGVVAFVVARQLLEDGNEVKKLFLIDMACPIFASSLPGVLVDVLDSIDHVGIVDDEIREKNIGRLITSDHFTLARQQLLRYKVSKLPCRKMP
ncbi:thioesterase domain-containing protein [Hirsutella rhossiliensis]|uniref:Thioesterase domain-containing protein n=1 Tax=Hirsutella rhossiliensis TaxID=111463 RepID=A0A9P8MR79_9HYPO|nr:thioesterase domain-containing protein [Hirsutella rhossiliensis]KAH0958706.1 thioesterase domain-containing protein [Hirsutella rhossiliensis]